VTYRSGKRHLKAVTEDQLFETPHRSPQPPLWTRGKDEWEIALRLRRYAPRRRRIGVAAQAAPCPVEDAVAPA